MRHTTKTVLFRVVETGIQRPPNIVGVHGAVAVRASSEAEEVGCGFPANYSLTLDEWDREKSNGEDIETSEDDQGLVSSPYRSVHRSRARAQQATNGQPRARLDGLSIRLRTAR